MTLLEKFDHLMLSVEHHIDLSANHGQAYYPEEEAEEFRRLLLREEEEEATE